MGGGVAHSLYHTAISAIHLFTTRVPQPSTSKDHFSLDHTIDCFNHPFHFTTSAHHLTLHSITPVIHQFYQTSHIHLTVPHHQLCLYQTTTSVIHLTYLDFSLLFHLTGTSSYQAVTSFIFLTAVYHTPYLATRTLTSPNHLHSTSQASHTVLLPIHLTTRPFHSTISLYSKRTTRFTLIYRTTEHLPHIISRIPYYRDVLLDSQ